MCAKSKSPNISISGEVPSFYNNLLSFDLSFVLSGSFPECFSRLFYERLHVAIEDAVVDCIKKYLGVPSFKFFYHSSEVRPTAIFHEFPSAPTDQKEA